MAGRTHALKATPVARTVPTIWLLGSSDYSARLAAEKGMPYVFAHHFSGSGTAEALELYRSTFRPSPELAEPRTFLTVNAVVAESAEEAERRALPNLLMMVALRTGAPLGPQLLVEEAEKARACPTPTARSIDAMRSRWVIGDPASARAQLGRARRDVRRGRGDGPPGRRRPRRHRPGRAARPARRRCACWPASSRIWVSAPEPLDWYVGPTWVCLVAPRGCPERRVSTSLKRVSTCAGEMRSHGRLHEVHPAQRTCRAGRFAGRR